MRIAVMLSLMAVIFSLVSCKKEEIPEHILQQQRLDKERQQRRENLDKERQERLQGKEKKKTGLQSSHKDEKEWPEAVQKAAVELFKARGEEVPVVARKLAQQGLEAVSAMWRIISSKYQSKRKRVFVSLLMVERHMFRVGDLKELAREYEMPFVQRAAIESLKRIGNTETERALLELRAEFLQVGREERSRQQGPREEKQHSHESHPSKPSPEIPLLAFMEDVMRRQGGWGYGDKDLSSLDRLFQATSTDDLKVALDWITQKKLEQGLLAIVKAAGVNPKVFGAAVQRLLYVAREDTKKLKNYCGAGYPQFMRMAAVKFLLAKEGRAAHGFLKKLAKDPTDPMSGMIPKLLE